MKKNTEQEEAGDDISKNKRRADDSLPEKEPSKKKTKDSKKKESFSNWWCFKIWRKGFIWRKKIHLHLEDKELVQMKILLMPSLRMDQ